jgi:hypothetical protein
MTSVDQSTSPVSLSLIDLDLEKRHRLARQKEIVQKIAEQDECLTSQFAESCPVCGAKMHRHGKTRPRELWTLAGMVFVSLSKLRCPACHHFAVPAQVLVADGLLSSLAEVFVELCRSNSFAHAARLLNKLFDIDIPVMTLHAYVRRQSTYFDDEIAKDTDALFKDGLGPVVETTLKVGAPLYLAIDEGLMHEWSYCHNKETRRDETKQFVTAYCAVFFDGRRRISSMNARPRYALTNRYGHASATTSINQFFSELVMLSYKRGYASSHPLFILGDGAKYLAKGIEAYFPCAVHLLDIFHLKKRVGELIYEGHPLYERSLEALHSYDPKRLLAVIDACRTFDEREHKLKRELVKYVTRNAQFISNHRDPRTCVHGSASAEKAVDLLIARRFKNRGMSWTESGCEVLLQFQVLDYNNKLDEYWRARHEVIPALCAAKQREEEMTSQISTAQMPRKASSDKLLYYHQVALVDCERTKGINLN